MSEPPKDRDAVIGARYLAGETLALIAKDYGITRERVRQIVKEGWGSGAADTSKMARRRQRELNGPLTQKEETQLRTKYRYELRLFHEEQVALLYGAGMSLADISKLIMGKYESAWTAAILERLGIARRKPGGYQRTTDRRSHYPWDRWMDGRWHEAKQVVDFECKPHCFRAGLYRKAKEHQIKVEARIVGNVVRFRFLMPALIHSTERTA